METMQYVSFLRFSLQLLLCEAVFLLRRPLRPAPVLRFLAALAGYWAAGSGLWLALRQLPGYQPLIHALFYCALFALTLAGIGLCFELAPIEVLFVGTGGYATEHIAYAATRILLYFLGATEEALGAAAYFWLFRLAPYLLAAAGMYLLVIRRNRDKEEFKARDIRLVQMALVVLLAAIFLSVFFSRELTGEAGFLSQVICPTYSLLCCLLVLLMEYYVFRENRLTKEKEMMEQLLQMADGQQKASREAIDIINLKCHDLKHQMKALEQMPDSAQRQEYLAELRQAVQIYDATYHTGCEALDYILQEKTLLAEKHQIAFSCMADGAAVSFLSSADLYALLGNALDNALESAAQAPPGQRSISLRISLRGQMAVLHLENSCVHLPQFRDGMPITTKADKNYHGFGVRSIRYLAQKYGGMLHMQAREGFFLLDIALPVPNAQKQSSAAV